MEVKQEMNYRMGASHRTIIHEKLGDLGEVIDEARDEMTDKQFQHFVEEAVEELEKHKRGLR